MLLCVWPGDRARACRLLFWRSQAISIAPALFFCLFAVLVELPHVRFTSEFQIIFVESFMFSI